MPVDVDLEFAGVSALPHDSDQLRALAPKDMDERLSLICLNRMRPVTAPRVTVEERVRQLREHNENFLEYAAEDAIALWGILRGEAVMVD